jgi:hypothetical protein
MSWRNRMGYRIEAFLDDGKPSLNIFEIDHNTPCLSWTFNEEVNHQHSEGELHRLFRKLLLLTCKQDLSNVRMFSLAKIG